MITKDLSEKIASGVYAVGSRIPIEAELSSHYNVSRTVVRESLAQLRSDGLVVSRQGVGVFVAASRATSPFKIEPGAESRLTEVLKILELRIGMEVEASGHAAQRRTPAHMNEIQAVLRRTEEAAKDDDTLLGQLDFDFHLAIAASTGNEYFPQFLRFLSPVLIPRRLLQASSYSSTQARSEYLRKIHDEHMRIFSSIQDGNILDAREAMRLHLSGSLDRYRRLERSEAATT